MVLFPNPAGGSMEVANEGEARARGWNPTMGSFGSQSYPSAGGAAATSATAQAQMPGGQSDILEAFRASSGFSIKQLDEQKRQFDADLAFKKQQWEQAGLPAAEVDRRVREAQIQEIQSQIALATANVTGTFNGQPTEAVRQFNEQLGLSRANLGLNYLTQAAQLGGPADYFQQSNFFRGAQGMPQVPTFLSALQRGLTMPSFGAPGGQAPEVQGMAGLANRLTGMPVPGGAQTGGAQQPAGGDAALGLIGAIGRTGGGGLAPQALEQLSPDELALFGSGLKASGFSMPSFLQNYQQSRIGQSAAIPMQHGGIVDRPTLAMIGEAGPEAVVPLDPNQWQNIVPSVVQGETPPTPQGMPLYGQSPQPMNTMQFESPDQVVAMADRLGLQGQARTDFFMRYFNPNMGRPMRPRLPSEAPIPRYSDMTPEQQAGSAALVAGADPDWRAGQQELQDRISRGEAYPR